MGSMPMTLPFDVARCRGRGGEDEGWGEHCETCLRRTSPGDDEYQLWMEPPTIIAFECPFLIEPENARGN